MFCKNYKKLIISSVVAILILCNLSISKATTKLETKYINIPNYKVLSNVSGEGISCCSRTDNLMLFVTDSPDRIFDKEYATEFGNYYKISHNKLYYTNDGITFGNTDLEAIIRKMYSLGKDSIIDVNSMERKDNTFYLCGLIKEKGTAEYLWKYRTILLKTVDGKNFEKLNIPLITTTTNDIIKIYQYKGTYIIAGAHDYSQEKNHYYYYYTSTDLKNWTKRIIKEPWEYDDYVDGLLSITMAGVSFRRYTRNK
ncbi:MAG: glycoside hydrolase family 32 protein [Clostridia bacterium]|jgi:hypothetical protein|nr:glycoside hydrolase family 32 protein [Clostridia bacterium]